MTMYATCPHCRTALAIDADSQKQSIRCSGCGNAVRVQDHLDSRKTRPIGADTERQQAAPSYLAAFIVAVAAAVLFLVLGIGALAVLAWHLTVAQPLADRKEQPPQRDKPEDVAKVVDVKQLLFDRIADLMYKEVADDFPPNKIAPWNMGTWIHVRRMPKERMLLKLPGVVRDVVVGGAGRFLLFHVPSKQRLFQFDVVTHQFIRSIPVDEPDACFAAGVDKLIVLLPKDCTMQRWNLLDGTKEGVLPLPFHGVVKCAAMGAASDGPLLVHWALRERQLPEARWDFIDIYSAKKQKVVWNRPSRFGRARDYVHARASHNGKVFTLWCTSHSPTGIETIHLNGKQATRWYFHTSSGHILPSADGTSVFTSQGPFALPFQLPPDKSLRDYRYTGITIPARHGPFYVQFPTEINRPGILPNPPQGYIRLLDNGTRIVKLPPVPLPEAPELTLQQSLTLDKRIHVIPAAKLLVMLPAGNAHLYVQRLNLHSLMIQKRMHYLVCPVMPRPFVRKGERYTYTFGFVTSPRGRLHYVLSKNPPGMSLKPGTNRILWEVPKTFPQRQVDAEVTAVHENGMRSVHRFTLVVR